MTKPRRVSRRERPEDQARTTPLRRQQRAEPPSFITLDGLRRHGWNQVPGGWLVESSTPLTSDQIADARNVAANTGLRIEVQREGESLTGVMAIAMGAGALLALTILALTVGLIRSESAGDLRTLTATGASSGIRRTLTATTAGALALLGALLGVAGAYVALSAIYHDDLGYLARCRFSSSPSASSACRWPPQRPAGSWRAENRPPSPGQ